jgi:hypothetical protein
MISYMIFYYLSHALALDASVTVEELCTCFLNTITDICCAAGLLKG